MGGGGLYSSLEVLLAELIYYQFIFGICTDVESHHQRSRSDRIGSTYSPERIDNESPGECCIRIQFFF